MPLPKINAPIFELNLPSTGKPVKYRPFLVKEQKILMLAMEGDEQTSIVTAIKQIINNCAIDPVDVDKLPTFDLEYFFTRLRAKSIGEKVDLRMRHPNNKNAKGNECRHETSVSFNLMNLEVSKKDGHTEKIVLDEETGVGVKMKYPTMEGVLVKDAEKMSQLEVATEAMINSIEFIFDKEAVYNRDDYTRAELKEFIDNLSQTQFEKLAQFFDTMPKLKQEIKWKCSGCEEEESVTLEGMSSFFVF